MYQREAKKKKRKFTKEATRSREGFKGPTLGNSKGKTRSIRIRKNGTREKREKLMRMEIS